MKQKKSTSFCNNAMHLMVLWWSKSLLFNSICFQIFSACRR